MILASHIILTAYGFWLPNDPRGSGSTFVGAWELFYFGKATKTDTTASLAHVEHDRARRLAAKRALQRNAVQWSGIQAREIARAFAATARDNDYRFLALSILPSHIHAVIRDASRPVEDVVGHLKYVATQRLRQCGLHPFQCLVDRQIRTPTMWTKRSWKVFLDSEQDVTRAIEYVRENPLREGMPEQRWSFVESQRCSASPEAPRTRGG